MSDLITVQEPRIKNVDGRSRVVCDVVCPDKTFSIWFSVGQRFADLLSAESSDAFFLVALLVAMRRDDVQKIRVEGALSSKLYYNVKLYASEVLCTLIPALKKVEISADRLVNTNLGGRGVFTGFSAGVDSYCTIADHLREDIPSEFRLTHLLFNNVGSHGQTAKDKEIFEQRYARLNEDAENLGLPLIAVDSNIDAFIGMGFQLTHTLRNVAVALVMQRCCGQFLYSSGVHYTSARVEPTYDIAYADTVLLPLLSTETVNCISSGSQYTRFQKTERVADLPQAFVSLDICVYPSLAGEKINCSRCWKCLRTQASLEILGKLELFSSLFDNEIYKKFRWFFLCDLVSTKDPLLLEVKKQMEHRGASIPFSAKLCSRLVPKCVRHDFVERRILDLEASRLRILARMVKGRILDRQRL